MPRIKSKPHRFQYPSTVETEVAQNDSSTSPTARTATCTPEPTPTSLAPPSSDEQFRSHHHVTSVAHPFTNLITNTSCLSIPTVTFLTQEAIKTANNTSNEIGSLVSTTIIPNIAPLGLAIPTVPTLAIDLGSMLLTNTSETLGLLNKLSSPIASPQLPASKQSSTPIGQPQQPYRSSEIASTASFGSSTSMPNTLKSTSFVISEMCAQSDKERTKFNEVKRSYKKDRELTNCAVCHKLMRRGSIREHMDRHNNSGRYECSECGKTFSRASAREKHFRIHTGEKPYQCPHCSKAYRQRVHLNEHMRSHTGHRPYVCSLCGFALASKSLLNRHVRTHWNVALGRISPERNDCSMDDKAKDLTIDKTSPTNANIDNDDDDTDGFHPKDILSTMSLPTNPLDRERLKELWRKHTCEECSTGFPTLQALRSHRMTTHGFVPSHPCPQCCETFSSNKLRKQHLRLAHPQVGSTNLYWLTVLFLVWIFNRTTL
ncbi:Zinc finger protein [Fasciolopsis buskii]|uniref:Zinc finger protein n=1 Tax=Fasciolopsis buskii TaxID=27845 RepID=A0A8E0VDT0_9TREM|nr:Zinc finger protein [Fasciolopsis buski]